MAKILIIDALNLFVRSWAAYPQLTTNGDQFGGCIGFLKTLRRLVADICPTAVYIAWESGGSARRRKLLPEYKLNRKPEKLNRYYGDDIPESEQNRQHQTIALLTILKSVPVCQVYVPNCEGDDVIAYLSCGPFRDHEKVIASSDKDMYQLLNDKTVIYNFHRKTYVTQDDLFKETRIKAHNFAVAKAVCGDTSDNVPGIKGVGFKTAAKRIPILGGDETIILEDLFAYCSAHLDEAKIYRSIVENREDVIRNWKVVYLDGSALSATQVSKIEHVITTFKPRCNKMEIIKFLIKEGITDFDVDGFLYPFNCMTALEYVSGDKND